MNILNYCHWLNFARPYRSVKRKNMIINVSKRVNYENSNFVANIFCSLCKSEIQVHLYRSQRNSFPNIYYKTDRRESPSAVLFSKFLHVSRSQSVVQTTEFFSIFDASYQTSLLKKLVNVNVYYIYVHDVPKLKTKQL